MDDLLGFGFGSGFGFGLASYPSPKQKPNARVMLSLTSPQTSTQGVWASMTPQLPRPTALK